jgi:hypothetical protein
MWKAGHEGGSRTTHWLPKDVSLGIAMVINENIRAEPSLKDLLTEPPK